MVPSAPISDETRPRLRSAMGLRDVVLLFVTAGTNLQWVAIAAAAGPSAVGMWGLSFLTMALPLAWCVIEMSSRYPQEGGLYVWAKHSFGGFAGFMTGWTYWSSNLPYFPGLLYFTAANALYIGGERFLHLSLSPAYFIVTALLGLALGTGLNIAGLDVAKWLTNVGAVARWLATLLLLIMGGIAWSRFGSATEWSLPALVPSLGQKQLVFWSTLVFAWTGFEAASFMGGEIEDARRNVSRGILFSAPLIIAIYVLGTVAVLLAVPVSELTGLQGVMQAIDAGARRIEAPWITPVMAVLIVLTTLGSLCAWLGAVARIPFVAGIDHYLPEAFGRMHPRWGSPYMALLTQSGITVLFVFMGQAGTNVKGAYNALVSMTVVATMIPFFFIFASALRIQAEPRPVHALRLPGGRPLAAFFAIVGLAATFGATVLACFPAPDEPRKLLAVGKIMGMSGIMVSLGVAVYLLGRRRAAEVAR
jgi:glutamate:GABA antiporter